MTRAITLPNGVTVRGLSETDTRIVYREIFEEQIYRMHDLSYRDGDVIFDVGANTGLFAIYLQSVCPTARYFAFEPIPEVFSVLRDNVQRSTTLDSQLFNVGLSAGIGQADFVYYPRLSCASSMYPDTSMEEAQRGREYVLNQMRFQKGVLAWPLALMTHGTRSFIAERVRRYYRRQQVVSCPLRTVSDVYRECALDRIDLLKVDAERAERDILAGIAPEHWPCIRQLVVEVHDPADLPDIEGLLQRRGFDPVVERHADFANIHMVYCVRSPPLPGRMTGVT